MTYSVCCWPIPFTLTQHSPQKTIKLHLLLHVNLGYHEPGETKFKFQILPGWSYQGLYCCYSFVRQWYVCYRWTYFKLVMVDSSLAWGVTCQVVVMAALAIFPLTPAGLSSRAYRFALLGSVIACAHSLYQQHQVCDSTH